MTTPVICINSPSKYATFIKRVYTFWLTASRRARMSSTSTCRATRFLSDTASSFLAISWPWRSSSRAISSSCKTGRNDSYRRNVGDRLRERIRSRNPALKIDSSENRNKYIQKSIQIVFKIESFEKSIYLLLKNELVSYWISIHLKIDSFRIKNDSSGNRSISHWKSIHRIIDASANRFVSYLDFLGEDLDVLVQFQVDTGDLVDLDLQLVDVGFVFLLQTRHVGLVLDFQLGQLARELLDGTGTVPPEDK